MSVYESRVRQQKAELAQTHDVQRQLQQQLQQYEHRAQELNTDLTLNIERNKQNLADFSQKEEELVVVRVELANLHDKHKVKLEEVRLLTHHGVAACCCLHMLMERGGVRFVECR